MKKKVVHRFKRRPQWLLETLNTKTNKTRHKTVFMSYDDVPDAIERIRKRNQYMSVSMTEVDPDGTPKTNGRVLTECSREDDKMIRNTPKEMRISDVLIVPEDDSEALFN